jgi:hypothetical protein
MWCQALPRGHSIVSLLSLGSEGASDKGQMLILRAVVQCLITVHPLSWLKSAKLYPEAWHAIETFEDGSDYI